MTLAHTDADLDGHEYVSARHNGRRGADPHGIWRHPWVRKGMAVVAGAAIAVAGYFWNESRDALRDIGQGKMELVQLKTEVAALRNKVDDYSRLSDQQRQELRQDVRRVEDKVDGLNERLTRWFSKATK